MEGPEPPLSDPKIIYKIEFNDLKNLLINCVDFHLRRPYSVFGTIPKSLTYLYRGTSLFYMYLIGLI